MVYKDRNKLIARAKKLREEGMSYQKIADELGVRSCNTIRLWIDSAARKREYTQNKHYWAEHRDECSAYAKNRYQNHKAEYIARAKKWHQENPRRSHEIQVKYKTTHREELREQNREYCATHKALIRQYYEEHRQEINGKNKAYHNAHKEECNVRSREYYRNHKAQCLMHMEEWRQKNPERARELRAKYRETHREELLAREYLRKGRIKEYAKITQPEYDAIFEQQKGLCIYCGKMMLTTGNPSSPDYKTLEHIYPLDKGGPHIVNNLAFACRSCNSSKGVKTVANWRPGLLAKIGNGVRNKK